MENPQPLINYQLTDHAREEAERRKIPLSVIAEIMTAPQQITDEKIGRKAYQSQHLFGDTLFLVRVIVEITSPLLVITVYRTSRIQKYWKRDG